MVPNKFQVHWTHNSHRRGTIMDMVELTRPSNISAIQIGEAKRKTWAYPELLYYQKKNPELLYYQKNILNCYECKSCAIWTSAVLKFFTIQFLDHIETLLDLKVR